MKSAYITAEDDSRRILMCCATHRDGRRLTDVDRLVLGQREARAVGLRGSVFLASDGSGDEDRQSYGCA